MSDANEAPGRLDLVRDFVNSWDYPNGPDRFAEPEAAGRWCGDHGLPSPANQAECDRLRTFREALRDVLFANNGEGDDVAAWERLAAHARNAPMVFAFDSHRGPHLHATGTGADAINATMLAIASEGIANGTWQRLRACRKDSCRFAYYDRSKNASRAWCDMAVCGNREKAARRRMRDRTL